MSDRLNVPSDLRHLIENREQDERRVAERRQDEEAELGELPLDESRVSQRRVETPRRKSDA